MSETERVGQEFILTLSCPDKPGIVYTVSSFLVQQDVMRVDHTFPPQRLAEAGRDVEAQVLARAVTWHAEHRVLLNGNRTVILH